MSEELQFLREENEALRKWRADVTVALQRPGGAFYDDVPKHIRALRDELIQLARVCEDTVDFAESENWRCYNGTDESRLGEIEKALESLQFVPAVDPDVESGQG